MNGRNPLSMQGMRDEGREMCGRIPTCRSISKSIAFCMLDRLFMFLISTLVPNGSVPFRRTYVGMTVYVR